MSVFILQIIAVITMLCDHIAKAFLDSFWLMRLIGRIAFPIYAFLIAEGFRHIKNEPARVSKHLGGYVILALISEIGFDLVAADKPYTLNGLLGTQSVIFTLLLSFLGLLALDKWKGRKLRQAAVVILTAFTSVCLKTDYSLIGVLLVYALYYYLERCGNKRFFKRLLILYGIFLVYIPLHWITRQFFLPTPFFENIDTLYMLRYIGYLLVPPILAAYNGKPGFYNKKFKLFYRYFYPAHLLVIGLILQVI